MHCTLPAAGLLFLLLAQAAPGQSGDIPPAPGKWRAWLESPGGELPFALELDGAPPRLQASILNGAETVPCAITRVEGGRLLLAFTPFDAYIDAEIHDGGTRLRGTYEKSRGDERPLRMPFHAVYGDDNRFSAPPASPGGAPGSGGRPFDPTGRWAVTFSASQDPAVAVLRREGRAITGTFLTALGDYRYLEGRVAGSALELSCFDGAHAFLFRAFREADGSLRGDFWSGDTWHETWTAKPDAQAATPDPWSLTQVRGGGGNALLNLTFPDLDGNPSRVDEHCGTGGALVVLFGSWCPNCHDAARLLQQLDARYRSRGLSVVGLAFEVGSDAVHNRELLRAYRDRYRLRYPILLAGPADKKGASRVLPMLTSGVVAYPTTLFLRGDGTVQAVYTGFTGPAAADDHERMRASWEKQIDKLTAR